MWHKICGTQRSPLKTTCRWCPIIQFRPDAVYYHWPITLFVTGNRLDNVDLKEIWTDGAAISKNHYLTRLIFQKVLLRNGSSPKSATQSDTSLGGSRNLKCGNFFPIYKAKCLIGFVNQRTHFAVIRKVALTCQL